MDLAACRRDHRSRLRDRPAPGPPGPAPPSRRHHDRLWIPLLHHAFPRGTARADLDRPLGRLHGLRNRAAHHENLLRANLPARHQDVLDVAALLAPELATHVKATSTVPALLGERPR